MPNEMSGIGIGTSASIDLKDDNLLEDRQRAISANMAHDNFVCEDNSMNDSKRVLRITMQQ